MAIGTYEYGTSPRKLNEDYVFDKVKRTKNKVKIKAKENAKISGKTVLYLIVVFGILGTISFRNSLINETYSRKERVKSEVSALEKENEQLKISIENSLNLENIEREAREKLGMQKSTNAQKVFITVEKQDYIESSKNEIKDTKEKFWLVEFVDNIISNIK